MINCGCGRIIYKRRSILDKRGQITLFMIVGIVLLLFTSIVIYIRQVSIGKRNSPIESVYKIPEEAQPIHDYISACLRDKTKDALIILGEQGGYIYPEEFGVTGNYAEPTEESGLQFSRYENYVIPYWSYMKSKNTCLKECRYDSEQPLLKRSQKGVVDSSIESQIDVYLNENLEECLNNFAEFKERGYQITIKESPDITSYVTQTDVTVNLEMPVQIRKGDSEVNLYKITTHTPINLKEMYELASEITQKQSKSGLFEWQLITLISAYGGPSEDALPPIIHFDFSLGDTSPPMKWEMSTVKHKIRTLITSYTPTLLVANTTNYYPPYIIEDSQFQDRIDPSKPVGPIQGANAMLNSFVMPLPKEYDYSVSFSYLPDWEPYINVRPNTGKTITPEESGATTDLLREIGIGLNKYQFQYDASYPVLVKITDPYAFDEEGYSFVFALEANMRNNEPLTDNASFSTKGSLPSGTFACDDELKVTGNITVMVIDGNNSRPVEDAEVFYNFAGESCYIGMTKKSGSHSAQATGQFPKGIGKIQVSKEGYMTSMKLFATKENQTQRLTILLYPKIDKPLNFMLKNIDKIYLNNKFLSWDMINPNPYVPGNEISAIMTFERIPDKTSTSTHKKVAYMLNGNQEGLNVTLAPGEYTLKIMTTDSENTSIPMGCAKWNYGPFPKEGYELDMNFYNEGTQGYHRYCKKDRVLNATNITMITMIEFNTTYSFQISPSDLYEDKPLTVYGIYLNLKGQALENRTHTDLEEMEKIQEYYFPRYYGQFYPR